MREDSGERVATLTLTLVAEAALRSLARPAGAPQPGSVGLPYGAAAGRAPGVSASLTPQQYPTYY